MIITGIPGAQVVECCDPEMDARFPVYTYTSEATTAAPWVLISHGSGGSPYTHRNLAAHLAAEGFRVAVPLHPGNNRDDNSLANSDLLLSARPRQARLVLDAIGATEAAIVGHSMGGYTALALAPDPRLRAIVLLAPATIWLRAPGALAQVRVPVLLFRAEKDQLTPPMHADIVRQGLPATTPLEERVIPNAGHFSFLSPFPPERTSPSLPPSQDPPGFDRLAFHAELYPAITTFLRRALPCPSV